MGQSVKTTLAPENPQNRKKTENQKMCHPSQSSPNQNQAWQGVYPDLSTFNALFSPAAPTPNPQSSPWISFLGSLGLQPIPQEQQQQGSAQEHPSAPPVPEENPWSDICWIKCQQPAQPRKRHPVSTRSTGMLDSILRLLLRLPSHQAAVPSGHLSPPPLLLRRHPSLHHLLLCHRPLLHPLQPPWLPHPFRLYFVLATSLLGLPLPSLLAGHVIYSVVTFLHPLCALVLLLPCLHKLHVRRLPLATPANWGSGFTGANAAWTHHHHQGHQ